MYSVVNILIYGSLSVAGLAYKRYGHRGWERSDQFLLNMTSIMFLWSVIELALAMHWVRL